MWLFCLPLNLPCLEYQRYCQQGNPGDSSSRTFRLLDPVLSFDLLFLPRGQAATLDHVGQRSPYNKNEIQSGDHLLRPQLKVPVLAISGLTPYSNLLTKLLLSMHVIFPGRMDTVLLWKQWTYFLCSLVALVISVCEFYSRLPIPLVSESTVLADFCTG